MKRASSTTPSRDVPGHLPALDGLRALAILLVIPHNGDIFSNAAPWLWPVAIIVHAGWLGVHLFFVLSGFLITRNLLASREATNYLQAFYGRRILRIFPLYFLTLFVALVVLPAVIPFDAATLASHRNQIWLWTFLINWVQPFGVEVSGFSHFWSLAVEEQFYLAWPVVILAFTGRRFLWICAALVGVAFVARVLLLQAGVTPAAAYMFTICRMDALVIGAVAAVLADSPAWMGRIRQRSGAALLLVLGLLIVTAAISHADAAYDVRTLTVGYPLLAFAFALLILVVCLDPPAGIATQLNALLSLPALRSIGRYSYAMYVFHFPILVLLGASFRNIFAFAGPAMPLFYAIAAVITSYIAGLLSYHLLEKHFLRFKQLFTPAIPAVRGEAS